MTNVSVGNPDITVTEPQLRELFAAYGSVETITLVKNRDPGEPRGIAFVEKAQSLGSPGIYFWTKPNHAERPSDQRERSWPEASSRCHAQFGAQRSSATPDLNCELVNYPGIIAHHAMK